MVTSNNREVTRVAKNTIMLYVRMAFLMVVGLITSRVNLDTLGIDNYGIYSLVGGFVALFVTLSGSFSAAISRFITYELGTGDEDSIKKVFSASIIVQIILSVLFVILAETIGLWFVNSYLHFPSGRLKAANIVYQISIVSFVISLLSVPYNSSIIAHEDMGVFAVISIIEGIGKLTIAYLTYLAPFDKLVFFSLLNCFLSLVIRLIYAGYCKNHYVETKTRITVDRPTIKRMISFSGWNFFGAGSLQLMTQGVNVLSNTFFGVVVNAARGVTDTVVSTIGGLVANFTTALNPQITKAYAANDRQYMFDLLYKGAKFSFFLLMIISVPFILEADVILSLWLKEVPDNTVVFVRLALINSQISVLSNTMMVVMLATGDIKKYQLIVGGLGMLVLPISWILFAFGAPAFSAYLVVCFIYILQLVARLFLLRDMVGMSISTFLRDVLSRCVFVLSLSMVLPLLIHILIEGSIIRFVVVCLSSIVCSACFAFLIGLGHDEKSQVILYVKKRMKI